MGAIDAVVLADEDDGEQELVGLVERVEDLVAGDGDGARAPDAALDLDVARLGQLAIGSGRVGCLLYTSPSPRDS